jgi:hypothetical protein
MKMSAGMLHRLTDVSDVFTASISAVTQHHERGSKHV